MGMSLDGRSAEMISSVDSVSLLNPNLAHPSMPFRKLARCLNFHPLLTTRASTLSLVSHGVSPNGLPLHRRTPLIVAFAAQHEDSKHREIEVDDGKEKPDIGSEESQEAWKQAVETFREQAKKIQGVSQEAYEVYSKKAIIILKDTSEQLKVQAEKARQDLSVAAKEISEEGKEYLTTATENSPEVKEIVETFTSPTDDLNQISEVRDFYVGIPYGLILSLGGFLSFMVTGSTAAIRFGMILGGVLLALGISSLKAYKRGETSPLAFKGQAAIASILFLREINLLAKGSALITWFTALISGAVVAFYVYRWVMDGKPQKDTNLESGAQS
ncbi:protein FATTY ACID EXPORT 3, chloroplastic [Senna tora]|uniref:Protein FATTY ACID EXPORT 3, chloroplastic n=1 Tax=Senna tora TaxID=362788 RepID=A0A834WJM1_9FABA|nr:protein FATTY ACID EXPORT 3, chloroplastic [Senna tora]